MPEQEECCILSICCEPTKARDMLAAKLQAEIPLNKKDAAAVAAFIMEHYDLAPHGLFKPLRDYIANEAREYPYV
jgi:hypothetical protein